ncbi:MAG: DUF4007 family protein [Opitutaceae bacterium]
MIKTPQPRLSGHESFSCRFAWLPKVVKELDNAQGANSQLFKDENEAMVRLGVGKNMVRSIKFWAEVSGLIEAAPKGGHQLTAFGARLLGHEGHDPYLERQETLWLLHWKISTSQPPVFYWDQMLNHWHRQEFSLSEMLPVLSSELPSNFKSSERTLADGFKVFLKTYVPTRGPKGDVQEDNLDCPLVELNFIHVSGQRLDETTNRPESLYSFNYEDKSEVTDTLFAYCLNDFWAKSPHSGDTLAFNFISSGKNSPGQIFKLPEPAVRRRLENLKQATKDSLDFMESNTVQQVMRISHLDEETALDNIYID